ncbi:AraC family transcriptional regulator [Caulobacter sp. 73W]|uniref:AraC family transcriptional regulator n=1 Tax=Caulobacter sp. 73W TaxID=3161137 RepID=A0AB39KX58_9CAUL
MRFKSLETFGGVELVRAFYPQRAFPTHTHREFVIGAVTSGAETLEVGRQRHIAVAGSTLLLHPEQAHANASLPPSPLGYSVFYIPDGVMTQWLEERPEFASAVSEDGALHERVRATHAVLERSSDRLEQETAFAALIEALGRASASAQPRQAPELAGADIRRVKDYIDDNYAHDFGLEQLSQVAGLSRFHLVRAFKRTMGLSPLAYRNQRRIDEARLMLHGGQTITQIALALGYCDHAHLTRQFQRIVGVSPSQYRAQ